MSKRKFASKMQTNTMLAVLLAVGTILFTTGRLSLLTPDQRAYHFYEQGDFAAAAAEFADPMWIGGALFRQGEFKKAAAVFAGFDTALSAFNHGNALVMQGQYDAAAQRYARALELRPHWQDAVVNREIAIARAAMLKSEGGNMTGGMLGADEIVFSEGESPPDAGDEVTEGSANNSDAEMRAIWLRQVQTKPADFLRAKFAYQAATRQMGDEDQSRQ